MRKSVGLGCVAVAWIAAGGATVSAQPSAVLVAVDADDIGGVVTGPNGAEAGVWVIAEHRGPADESQDRGYRRSGRYLAGPSVANYLFGYEATVSSIRRERARRPGDVVDLPAVIAPDAARRREVYPAELLVLAYRICRASTRSRDGR